MYDCDATVLLNVYIHLVFVGIGYAALVTQNLTRLRELSFMECENVHAEYFNLWPPGFKSPVQYHRAEIFRAEF